MGLKGGLDWTGLEADGHGGGDHSSLCFSLALTYTLSLFRVRVGGGFKHPARRLGCAYHNLAYWGEGWEGVMRVGAQGGRCRNCAWSYRQVTSLLFQGRFSSLRQGPPPTSWYGGHGISSRQSTLAKRWGRGPGEALGWRVSVGSVRSESQQEGRPGLRRWVECCVKGGGVMPTGQTGRQASIQASSQADGALIRRGIGCFSPEEPRSGEVEKQGQG